MKRIIRHIRLRLIYLILNFKFQDQIEQIGLSDFGKHFEISISSEGKMTIGTIKSERNLLLASAGQGNLTIGNVFFNQNCIVVCRNMIVIHDGCLFGPNVMIYDHDHIFDHDCGVVSNDYKTGSIVIEKNCWIGGGSIILKNTHIGEGTIVGAGCVVQGDIPAHSLVTGDRVLNIHSIK